MRIAETEKYAHVTFFFNGGREKPFPGEKRILIPSPQIATYDQKPAMSAFEVTQAVAEEMRSGDYDLIVVNYANLDMVGHTGKLWAAVKAAEAVDECMGVIMTEAESQDGSLLIISDHGNAEYMVDTGTGKPFTAHTGAPVHGVLVNYRKRNELYPRGKLADVAPTILELLGLDQPGEMTGRSLIKKA
jgi:2,3-bisphosphoglycerate-independent phosphoglycerate mutase